MSIYDEYGLEVEAENYGADPDLNPKPKVIVKKKRGVLGKILCLLLGVVIGAGGVVGGVAGVGYFAVTTPVNEVITTINGLLGTNINYADFINEEYATKNVLELVGDVTEIAGKFANQTAALDDLNAISPLIGQGVDVLIDEIEVLGVSLDKAAVMSKPVAELTDYLALAIQNIEVATFFKLEITDPSADPLLHALAFGYEGKHFTIDENGEVEWLTNEETGEPYASRKISDLTQMTDLLHEIRLATALKVTPESAPFMIALSYGSEGTGYKFGTDGEGNKIIIPLEEPNTLADLVSTGEDSLINTMKLKDFLGADAIPDDNILLKHLANETITSLPTAVEKLTFKQVYPGQIYVSRYMYYAEGSSEGILVTHDEKTNTYTDANGNSYQLDELELEYKHLDSENNVQWINSKNLYYCNKEHNYHDNPELTGDHVNLVLQAQWEYLLTEEDHVAHDYALSDFNALVKNMMNNMQTATLGDLAEDGILSGEQLSTSTLGTEVRTDIFTDAELEAMHITPPVGGEKIYVRDLTITQMLNYATALISKTNEYIPSV